MIHDTGVFQYSSTSPETMRIAGELMKKDLIFSRIIDESFYQKTYIFRIRSWDVSWQRVFSFRAVSVVGRISEKREMDFYSVKERIWRES